MPTPTAAALDAETARGLFDSMSLEEPTDFSLVETYYHPDVRFQDPIQQVQGRDAFIEMSEKLVKRCRELRARVNDAAQTGDLIFLQWTMEMRFGPSPLSIIEGVTKLRLDADGRVIEHRDYFDLWGDTLGSMPGLGGLYRRFVRIMG
jgi:limonene-1,2-epoxide hydrolase